MKQLEQKIIILYLILIISSVALLYSLFHLLPYFFDEVIASLLAIILTILNVIIQGYFIFKKVK